MVTKNNSHGYKPILISTIVDLKLLKNTVKGYKPSLISTIVDKSDL